MFSKYSTLSIIQKKRHNKPMYANKALFLILNIPNRLILFYINTILKRKSLLLTVLYQCATPKSAHFLQKNVETPYFRGFFLRKKIKKS